MADSQLLQSCITTHTEAIATVEKLTEGMSIEQGNWKPGPKKWSVAECIQHVNQGLEIYIDKLNPQLDKVRAANATGTEPYGRGTFMGRFIVNFLKKGPAKTAPAPKMFKPAGSGLELSKVVDDFRNNCKRFSELAEQADGLNLAKVKISIPVMPLCKLTGAQAFELHTLHTPRHLAQAERVKTAQGYPA